MADFALVQLRAAVCTATTGVCTRTARMISAEAHRRVGRVSPCAPCCGAPRAGGPIAHPGGVAQVCANPAPPANQRNQRQVPTLLRGIPDGAMEEPHGAVQGRRWRQAACSEILISGRLLPAWPLPNSMLQRVRFAAPVLTCIATIKKCQVAMTQTSAARR